MLSVTDGDIAWNQIMANATLLAMLPAVAGGYWYGQNVVW